MRVVGLVCFIALCASCSYQDSISNDEKIVLLQSKHSESSSTDSSYFYLKEAQRLIISEPLVADSLKAENNYLYGLYFASIGNLDSAAICFHNSLDFVGDKISSNDEVKYFLNAWNTYFNLGKYGDCISITERFQHSIDTISDFSNLSLLHYFKQNNCDAAGDYQKALDHNLNQVKFLRKANDTTFIKSALMAQAQYKYILNDKIGAFKILDSLVVEVNSLSDNDKYKLYLDYGLYRYKDKDYENALNSFFIASKHIKKLVTDSFNQNELARSYLNICGVLFKIEAYDKAQVYLDSAASIGINKIESGLSRDILEYQLELSFKTDGDLTKVNSYLDSIENYQFKQYQERYESDLVDLKKANEEQRQILIEKSNLEISSLKKTIALLSTIGVIIVSGIWFYKRRQYRFEKWSLQMQQRLLRAQMNPHFTFNALSTIQNYVNKDQNVATNYLLKFSRMLRLILENSMQNYVLIGQELELLRKYMDLQLLRFPSKFTYHFKLINFEEDSLIFIPPMLIQPFIENSIEHGFLGINYAGDITLTLTDKKDYLECIIDDNGQGLQSKTASTKKSTSTDLIKSFLKKVTKSEVEVISKSDIDKSQSGTMIKLLIPVKLAEND